MTKLASEPSPHDFRGFYNNLESQGCREFCHSFSTDPPSQPDALCSDLEQRVIEVKSSIYCILTLTPQSQGDDLPRGNKVCCC